LLGNDYEMACVATRAQTKKQEALARKVAEDEKRTGVRPSPLVLEQDEEDIQSEEEDSASSRQEEIVAQPPTVFDVKPEELRKQQLKDVSLQSAWEDAVSEVQAKELETCFVKNRDGFLMRKWTQLPKHGPATEGSQAVMQVRACALCARRPSPLVARGGSRAPLCASRRNAPVRAAHGLRTGARLSAHPSDQPTAHGLRTGARLSAHPSDQPTALPCARRRASPCRTAPPTSSR